MQLIEQAELVKQFVKEKGWDKKESRKPQSPKNLAVSIAIEAGELLECFQWSEVACLESIEEEMADILIYLLQLANVTGIDLEEAFKKKLSVNYKRDWK